MENKKILVLGNNDYSTDEAVSELAKKESATNNGLICESSFKPTKYGFYHTTLTDLSFGEIISLSEYFDKVILLDQPSDEWSHSKLLLSSYKLMLELKDRNTVETEFENNDNIKGHKFFASLVKENPSFCIYPWIEHHETFQYHGKDSGMLMLCSRSHKAVTHKSSVENSWQNNPDFNKIRNKMLAGEKLPEYCSYCYKYEEKNVESYRQFETKDWVAKLNIKSLDDLKKIDNPYYYEIFTSNLCNLMCRSCIPEASHLIAKEAKKHNIAPVQSIKQTSNALDSVKIETLTNKHRVYIHGGEPTIMPDVVKFLRECIKQKKTDFHLCFCTNGQQINKGFLDLVNQFSDVNFSFSLDGYGKINDYWRHGSDWTKIINNAKLLQSYGHSISINTVPGIYNVTNLHLLYEFIDREFPMSGIYLQINSRKPQDAYNHPLPELVVESMEKCQKTNAYYADGKSNKTCIDSLHEYYKKNPTCDLDALADFFIENDRLDEIRGMFLKDYIPELENCRQFLKDKNVIFKNKDNKNYFF